VEYIIITLLAIAATTVVIYMLANKVFGVSLRLKSLILCAACALFISIVLPRIVVSFAGLAGTVGFLAVFAVIFAYFVAYYDDPNELKAAANAVSSFTAPPNDEVVPSDPAGTVGIVASSPPDEPITELSTYSAELPDAPASDYQRALLDASPELPVHPGAEEPLTEDQPDLMADNVIPVAEFAQTDEPEQEVALSGALINLVFETAPADEPAEDSDNADETPDTVESAAPFSVLAVDALQIDANYLDEINPAVLDIAAEVATEEPDAADIGQPSVADMEDVEPEALPLYNTDIPLVPYVDDEPETVIEAQAEVFDDNASTEPEAVPVEAVIEQPVAAEPNNPENAPAEPPVAAVEPTPATEEEEVMLPEPQITPEPASDSLDDLLDFAFTQKELANPALALDAFRKALRLYRDSDAAPFLIIEIANLLKNRGAYDEAVILLTEGRTMPALQQDYTLDQEFINTIAYLRIVKNILLHNRLGFLPFNKIPAEITKEIDAEFRDWRSLA
jgi:hypothetical protein